MLESTTLESLREAITCISWSDRTIDEEPCSLAGAQTTPDTVQVRCAQRERKTIESYLATSADTLCVMLCGIILREEHGELDITTRSSTKIDHRYLFQPALGVSKAARHRLSSPQVRRGLHDSEILAKVTVRSFLTGAAAI